MFLFHIFFFNVVYSLFTQDEHKSLNDDGDSSPSSVETSGIIGFLAITILYFKISLLNSIFLIGFFSFAVSEGLSDSHNKFSCKECGRGFQKKCSLRLHFLSAHTGTGNPVHKIQ